MILDYLVHKQDDLLATMKMHRIEYAEPYDFIKPDKDLLAFLTSIQARLWIMTNSRLEHAVEALKRLGVYEYFEGIVYKTPDTYLGKTQRTFYDIAMLAADVRRPGDCYFIDDGLWNVLMAMNCGWHAVLYKHRLHREQPAIYETVKEEVHEIATLSQLRYVFPELVAPPPAKDSGFRLF